MGKEASLGNEAGGCGYASFVAGVRYVHGRIEQPKKDYPNPYNPSP